MRSIESATGRRWVFPDPAVDRLAELIAQRHEIPELLARVLAMRGVGAEQVPGYLDPRIRELMPDPHDIKDMEIAALRLKRAVEQAERIALIGDYDVDGACCVALIVAWLRSVGSNAEFWVPHRIRDGYGPNPEAMTRLGRTNDLLIVADSGSSPEAAEPIESARAGGADVIVADHHQCDAPPVAACAVINPNRSDDESGLEFLCAAGVTYMLLVAATRALRAAGWFKTRDVQEPDLMALLDLVALATVADVVPLRGLNRAFVRRGLRVLANRRRPGLAALGDVARVRSFPDEGSLGWMIGPRLNAPGRIGKDPTLAARVLLSESDAEAEQLAFECDALNEIRKREQEFVLEVARVQIEDRRQSDFLSWAADDGWHPGVVGIVAGRLTETFRRPVIVLGVDGEMAKGSGRSVPGLDLGSAVRRASREGVLERGGGHKAAVGLVVARNAIEKAMDRIERLLEASAPKGYAPRFDRPVAGVLTPSGVTTDAYETLRLAGPHGAEAPAPKFVMRGMQVNRSRLLKERHYRLELADGVGGNVKAMAFGVAGTELGKLLSKVNRGDVIHALGAIAVDDYDGGRKAYFRVEDIALQ